MIVAFSTSSPQTSVALIDLDGKVIAAESVEAPMRASGACLSLLTSLLTRTGKSLADATLFASDLGPGSFTGVKVGVTLAKTFAFAQGLKTIGVDCFQLIATQSTVVIPSKRGEWFVRQPGEDPIRSTELPTGPFVGYGPGLPEQKFPLAENFGKLLQELKLVSPEVFIPNYLIEPSISIPKKPLSPIGRHIDSL